MLHKRNLIPYILRLFYDLGDGDADTRLQFAKIFMRLGHHNDTLFDNDRWSDEVSFNLNGHSNRQHCVYWTDENPHKSVKKEVNLLGVKREQSFLRVV